jgi:hypothetical protein
LDKFKQKKSRQLFNSGRQQVKKIQGVTEKSALILTDNRTHQKQQLFSLQFWRKTLRNGLKKIGKIFLKPFISPKLS